MDLEQTKLVEDVNKIDGPNCNSEYATDIITGSENGHEVQNLDNAVIKKEETIFNVQNVGNDTGKANPLASPKISVRSIKSPIKSVIDFDVTKDNENMANTKKEINFISDVNDGSPQYSKTITDSEKYSGEKEKTTNLLKRNIDVDNIHSETTEIKKETEDCKIDIDNDKRKVMHEEVVIVEVKTETDVAAVKEETCDEELVVAVEEPEEPENSINKTEIDNRGDVLPISNERSNEVGIEVIAMEDAEPNEIPVVDDIRDEEAVKTTADTVSTPPHLNVSKGDKVVDDNNCTMDVSVNFTNPNISKEYNTLQNNPNQPNVLTKERNLIQDILCDWDVETTEDVRKHPKEQDLVEVKLKHLLDDTKATVKHTEIKSATANEKSCTVITDIALDGTVNTDHMQEEITKDKNLYVSKQLTTNSFGAISKDDKESPVLQNTRVSPKSKRKHSSDSDQLEAIDTISRSQAGLSKILNSPKEIPKETKRDKEKLVQTSQESVKDLPATKITTKYSGAASVTVPKLIPLPHSISLIADNNERRNLQDSNNETDKEGRTDNKELIAILEGDVDPDWSNLKPPTLVEESKTSINIINNEHSSPPKLDPLVEREIALKQLLELPPESVKTPAFKKKKVIKSTIKTTAKDTCRMVNQDTMKKIVSIDLLDEDSMMEKVKPSIQLIPDQDNNSKQGSDVTKGSVEIRLDESRSGRKRKPTEKAREHEETTKRQKVLKTKGSLNKKSGKDQIKVDVNVASTNDSTILSNIIEISDVLPLNQNNPGTFNNSTKEDIAVKNVKQTPTKKSAEKKKMTKKEVKRKPDLKKVKKTVSMKAKSHASSKKSGAKLISNLQKSATDAATGEVKPKKKIINEIDRLLQDEGVVNLLYDVEHKDKKPLVSITQSQSKVMDVQKAQRELKLRTKLVRNAVLRLRTATPNVTKVSPRSKRSSVLLSDSFLDRKYGEPTKSQKPTEPPLSSEFIIPAKIRNAADASIIVRRHSSSSFSGTSGSPRVSIDGMDKPVFDAVFLDTEGSKLLTKIFPPQDERIGGKKNKKKPTQKTLSNAPASFLDNEIQTLPIRSNKKQDARKSDGTAGKSKTNARSNGATSKSKKVAKNKTTIIKNLDLDDTEYFNKEDDKLSAVLAEAATALSMVSAPSRPGSSSISRKTKGNDCKPFEFDNNKVSTQFSNKEITVRRHGYLVQLILTPSSTTKIKNSITLQIIQEFRETLSILKRDDECRVVLLTSTGNSFCEGLELSGLLLENKDERRLVAEEYASAVKDFIKSLAMFNKPIVAGVQGAAVGLGVTMLPLFDLVIASDKATFSTPYGKLGQIAEGAAVFTLSHILGSAITSELLLGGRTLTASEALRAGLVTRVLWPDRFQAELLPTLKAMSEQSSQSMEATKALLRHSLRRKLEAALESETFLLIQHWCSTECQTAMKDYIDGKVP
ncbi:uncharacterized protein [Prorops nasuta]|uniref:uncharacterized protein isoform X2 n=1 Tax=Prorops nasuta TaxID=863751 RepID=UPI0034CDAA57